MSLPTPSAERLAASDDALRSLPGYSNHEPGEKEFAVLDPSTEERIATLPSLSPEEAIAQVAIAHEAGRAWAKTTPRHRSDTLHNAYLVLIANKERLAYVISREMGKTLAEAQGEVQYAADYVRWYADELLRPAGGYRDNPAGGSTILTKRAPVGLALLIAPWNFPMAMITRKIAPAIAAGCASVIKPAGLTPLTTLLTVELLAEAGVPRELMRVVTTTQSSAFSEAVLGDPRVRKISFTGSTGVGSTLMGLAAKNIVKSSMELGGNAPLIVFDDADLERAVEGAILAKLRNGGQSCVAANRIYVQDGIANDFVEAFSKRMSQMVLGHSIAEGVDLGPVINRDAVNNFQRLVDDAVTRGAELRAGGRAAGDAGYFFEATVLDRVPADADIANTEIFGPVAAISRFSTQEEVLQRANDTPFGLAGYVFTENLDRALNVADQLETGLVGINNGVPSNPAAPFGGMKQSGLGREGSHEGLEEYQEIRYYNIARRETR
ncbi:NAD-dependent succinate-semialdehyde dehydrogenase [Halopseudomonas bauzanensis]|uniref:Succinate semialdehyde dehydrogenase n=1 Tax=Halopseudomonas bauzanensis TaxID=653930 RepID=A0A1I4J8F6_9GAMM|nr:NAD-dependent succinate-semialdehyde dehydrogenase [Halopseudomonas bauzanensis]SER64571.1 succinate semialdehyde dehydrogenase [Halopseudomonas bauzanensis]SFL62875.1 succinate-semialdehyde dehydrogenase / glutarate-semialdehyde dehydrogenase [Halopseudomonas bauzanensis]